ncbi:MAG: type II toxin-antitoxin system prevent-host-death family antitoxin [Deltaproteobacteria bacterium]|nr:type II toxin-antitoxin system prevent-host-death family antitoxin [Deltaproteobacteria bacterium]
MIQVSVSEIKNRLSHYLKLVRGGEEVEILDRKTPVARLIHVSKLPPNEIVAPWVKEMEQLGIVTSPTGTGFDKEFLAKDNLPTQDRPGALEALLEQRETGR